MKFFKGQYYVELKAKRYFVHPTQNNILRLQNPPQSRRTQYQVQNNTQIRKNQKVIRNDYNELEVKSYPKNNRPFIHQPKFKPLNCPSCKRNKWLENDEGYYCQSCEYNITKEKHQIDNKVRRNDHYFSTTLPYAKKRLEKYIFLWLMVNKLKQMI